MAVKESTEAPTSPVPMPIWRRALSITGGIVLGAVLLVGAWAKAIDPAAFAEQVTNEGLDFLLPAGIVVVLALALEFGLGSALLVGIRHRWLLITSSALVLFFLFLTGRTYYRDSHGLLDAAAGCGCFGNLVDRTPAEAFWQDLALLVPALLLTWLGVGLRTGTLRWLVSGFVTVAGVVLGFLAPGLPLDDLATRLGQGVEIDNLCAGRDDTRICLPTLAPELEAGHHLVVIADLTDEGLGVAVDSLNAKTLAGDSVVVLSSATPEEHHAFFWSWGPAFEIKEAPPTLLSPLYRTKPRSFVVDDGRVSETFSGFPPDLDLISLDDRMALLGQAAPESD